MKIYSNQNLYNPEIIYNVNSIFTSENEWWMIYDGITKEIIIQPQQCLGGTSTPFTMVITNSKEELDQYIIDQELINIQEELTTPQENSNLDNL